LEDVIGLQLNHGTVTLVQVPGSILSIHYSLDWSRRYGIPLLRSYTGNKSTLLYRDILQKQQNNAKKDAQNDNAITNQQIQKKK
jgi:hypothetical protein